MNRTKIALAVAAVATLGSVAVGGVALAAPDNPTNRSGSSSSAPLGQQNGAPGGQQGGPGGQQGGPGGQQGGPAMHDHTPVTGDALTKLTTAVKAKGYTLDHAMADPDGSYDVAATKNGKPVMLEVSKDLKTITEHQGPPPGAPGGPGGSGGQQGGPAMHDHTPVTGSALTKLTTAVKAEGYTLDHAMADPDGSYDVAATKNGKPVMLEVSKDLKTITEHQGPPPGAPGVPSGAQPGSQPTIQGSKA